MVVCVCELKGFHTQHIVYFQTKTRMINQNPPQISYCTILVIICVSVAEMNSFGDIASKDTRIMNELSCCFYCRCCGA